MNIQLLKYLSIPFSKPLYDGIVGAYQTKLKGQGSDYDNSRPYDINDHPKYIDRKTTAKKDTLYSKQYHDEQQLHVCFLLDVGSSMQFGFDGNTKYDIMKNISLLLGSIIADHNDSCSLILYDQEIQHIDLNLSNQTIIPSLLKHLAPGIVNYESSKLHSNLGSLISKLSSFISRPTHFIVISDDQDDNALAFLSKLRKHHEISYLLIQHSLELQGIPNTIVSDGQTTALLPFSYKKQKELYNIKREQNLRRIGCYYSLITQQSNLQKSLLSLWR